MILSFSDMKLEVIISPVLFSLLLWSVSADDDKDDKKVKKLQIGVKKRVDPDMCKIKSRKGDVLHMHYTVCTVKLSTLQGQSSWQSTNISSKFSGPRKFTLRYQ